MVNTAVERGDVDKLFEVLRNNSECLGLTAVPSEDYKKEYMAVLRQKMVGLEGDGWWVQHWL